MCIWWQWQLKNGVSYGENGARDNEKNRTRKLPITLHRKFSPNYCFVYDSKRCESRMVDINNWLVSEHNFRNHFENVFKQFLRYFRCRGEVVIKKWNECELRIVCMRWQTIIGEWCYFYIFSIISSFLSSVAATLIADEQLLRHITPNAHTSHGKDNDRVASYILYGWLQIKRLLISDSLHWIVWFLR